MAAAILLLVAVFSAVALQMLRGGEREAALHGLQETTRASTRLIDRELGSALAALEVLATTSHLETGDLEGFYNRSLQLTKRPLTWCGFRPGRRRPGRAAA
ncbi:hypothetical protein [Polaromonas sp.]|uniref:hypothetical protein n=1 Tax=Polaromonas sp. TaxID=1869339 RepID=UPI003BB7AF03